MSLRGPSGAFPVGGARDYIYIYEVTQGIVNWVSVARGGGSGGGVFVL